MPDDDRSVANPMYAAEDGDAMPSDYSNYESELQVADEAAADAVGILEDDLAEIFESEDHHEHRNEQMKSLQASIRDDNMAHADVSITAMRVRSFVRESLLEQRFFGSMQDNQSLRDIDIQAHVGEIKKQTLAPDPDCKIELTAANWFGLLHPSTMQRTTYDFLQVFAIVYTCFVIPLRLGFDTTAETWSFAFMCDLVIDTAFMFDLVFNFNSYKMDTVSGTLIVDKKTIRLDYLKSWFIMDFIATFPIDYIVRLTEAAGGASAEEFRNLRVLRISRLARTTRMLRALKARKLRKLNEMIQTKLIQKPTLTMIYQTFRLWIFIFGLSHWISCIWLHLGRSAPDTGWMAKYGWKYQHGDGWSNPSHYDQYVDAFYWVIATMSSVGYGDVSASNPSEKVFSVFVMVLGGFMWALVIALFSELLSAAMENSRMYEGKIRRVMKYLRYVNAPPSMVLPILQFYRYRFEKHTLHNLKIFEELPPQLRRKLVAQRYQSTLSKVPFFRSCNDDTLCQMCIKLQPFSVYKGIDIIRKEDTSRDVFLVESGIAEAYVPDVKNPVEFFPEGSFFGEMSFFGLNGDERSATITAASYCEMFWISYWDLKNLLQDDMQACESHTNTWKGRVWELHTLSLLQRCPQSASSSTHNRSPDRDAHTCFTS